jgi:Raf kinase inhibitor-like YbhB/YbcL family protein
MKLTSVAFKDGEKIPSKYTCEGENINPPLEISGVPSHAKSLVLIMDDPDVPASVRKDQMFDHWVVFNLSPNTHKIEENATPHATLGKNTNGENEYFGPCPPDREHRYFFKLYALDKELDLETGASKSQVEQAMKGHVIEQAQLVGLYEKKRK